MAGRAALLVAAALLAAALPAAAARPSAAVVAVRDGDLWIGEQRLTETAAEESWPDWSPDRRRVAFARSEPQGPGSAIWVVRRDGDGLVRLTSGRDVDVTPAWSPDGERIAFARSPATGGSFDIWVVAARGGTPRPAARGPEEQVAPSWTRDGELRWQTLAPGEAWREKLSDAGTPRSGPRELLPDFDQRAPFRLAVSGTRLGFASATDNVGEGPVWIRGARPTSRSTMRATQLVRRSDGSLRSYPGVGRIRYTWSSSHSHWHLLDFQRYELRRAADHRLVTRDRKTGFCLADHYGLAVSRALAFSGARFFGNCAQGNPAALAVEQGTSTGYTDLYPAHFHGQNLELRGVPAGVYRLVHRANPAGTIEELDYANNAASLRIRLTWARGSPRVQVLRTCQATEYC